jgi:hypothetical protein
MRKPAKGTANDGTGGCLLKNNARDSAAGCPFGCWKSK